MNIPVTIHTLGQLLHELKPNCLSVSKSTSVPDLLHLLQQEHVTAITVCDDTQPVGIITERDCVRLAASACQFHTLTAAEVMSSPITTLEADESIMNAHQVMTRSNIRHLVVVDQNKKFLATLQEAELLCYLPAEHFLAPKPIHAIMTTNLITLHQDQPLHSALDMMSSLEISCVIVTDHSAPVGILSERDAIRLINEQVDLSYPLKRHMSTPIVTINHHATVMDAQQVMAEHSIRHLVVVDKQNEACGVLTQHDLITPTPDLLTRALRRAISSRSREMEHRLALENVFESIQDAGTLVVNGDGLIQFISPVVKQWCLLNDSAIGSHIDSLPKCPLLSLISRRHELGQGRLQEEFRHTLWDGRELSFEANLLPILDTPGSFFLLLRDITTRTKSHNELAAEFRLFEQGPVVVFRWSNQPGWPVEYVSANVDELTGFDQTSWLDSSVNYADRIHPEDLAGVMAEFKTVISRSQELFEHKPYRLRHRDRSWRWVFEKSTVVRDKHGEVSHFLGYLLDVTPQMEERLALRSAEQRWKFALEGARDGLWDWHYPSGEIYFSDQWKAILGYAPQEIGNNIAECRSRIHPDDLAGSEQELAAHIAGNSPYYQSVHRVRHKQGHYLWIVDRGRVIERDSQGQPLRIIGTQRDISEEKAAEQQLLNSEVRFRSLVENTNAVGWDYDLLTDQFTYVSPSSETILGYPTESWSNLQSWVDKIHPDDQEEAYNFCSAEIAQSNDHVFEYRIITPQGEEIWVRDVVSVVNNDAGTPSRLTGVIIDIDTLKRQTEQFNKERLTFQAVLDNAPVAIWLLGHDRKIRFVNETFCKAVGTSEQEFIAAAHYSDLLDKDIAVDCIASDEACFAGDAPHTSYEDLTFVDGKKHTLEITKVKLHDNNGELIGLIGIGSDITAKVKAEAWQRQAAVVFDTTKEGVIVTNADMQIIAVNQAFCDITGYSREEVLGQNPNMLQSGRHGERFYHEMWLHLQENDSWQGELWNRRKSGAVYPEWLTISTVRNPQGKIVNYVGVFADITQIKESQEEMEFLAHHDPLTSLPNRLLFNDRLNHALQRAKRNSTQLAVLFLDLDHFKHINDSLGHNVGDLLLHAVAERLRNNLRSEDTIARLGGDEFAILIEEISEPEEAAWLAKKLITAISQLFIIDKRELFIGVSIGISIYPQDGNEEGTLLRNADAAMYRAKSSGRNNYHFYTREMTTHAFEHVVLEGQLRRAIKHNELTLYYQPQISLKTGQLTGLEALIRWEHPEMGLVSPARFIPLAEETGLIIPIGEWVLREACRQGMYWQQQDLQFGRIAVNISGHQFRRGNLFNTVQQVLKETGFPADKLELEITESVIMGQAETTIERLHALRQLGITLSIDDFGTGFSSLSYLKRMPIDKLKIDRSFIRDLPSSSEDSAIARAIVALGHSMQLQVIAEGVETEAQQQVLRSLECDEMQGFLHSRPLPASSIEAQLHPRKGQNR